MANANDDTERWLRLEIGDGSISPLATDFFGREAISELHSLTVRFVVPRAEFIPFEKILGQSLRIHLMVPQAPPRVIPGIAASIRELKSDATFTYFETVLVPDVWLLTKTIRSRVFQQMTVPEILAKVFAGHSVDYSGIRANYPAHNFCVQYQESDFAFAARLMEEEGIHFFFREHERRSVMFLSDRSLLNPEIADCADIRFDYVEGGYRRSMDQGRIVAWQKNQSLAPGKYCVWDDHFQLPNQSLEATAAIVEEIEVGRMRHKLLLPVNRDLEIYDHNPGFAHRFDGVGPTGADRHNDLSQLYHDNSRAAKISIEAQASASVWIDGESNCPQLASGSKFRLVEHGSGDGEYLLCAVEHELTGVAYQAGSTGPQRYGNVFVAQPVNLPYRPAFRTRIPRAYPQSAVVVGYEEEDIFTDASGRVKVQFYWDREGKRDAHSSCWLRVIQPWAGSGYGHISLPRVGQEVMIDFLNGDPDAPFVLGSVHNPAQLPPRPLPEARTQTVFKSHTHQGDASSFNALGFDDTAGAEHLQLQAQKDMTTNVKDTAYSNYGTAHFEAFGKKRFSRTGGLPINYALTSGADSSDKNSVQSGSGSGGSDTSSGNSSHAGPFEWDATVMGEWAESTNIVFGRNVSAVVGADSELGIGSKTNTVLNPIGVVAAFGATASTAMTALGYEQALGVPVAGNVAAIIGTSSTAIYGPSFKVTRGHNLDLKLALNKPDSWKDFQGAAYIVAGLYALYRIGEQFVTLYHPNTSKSNMAGFAGSLIELEMINIWYSLEIANQGVKKWMDGTKKSLGELQVTVDKLLTNPAVNNAAFVTKMTTVVTEQIAQNFTAESMLGNKVAEELSGVIHNLDVDSMFSVTAPGISLTSTPDPEDDVGMVAISSYGGEDIDGILKLFASAQTTVIGGEMAYLNLQTIEEVDGLVTLDCGPTGTIYLQSGLEREPNYIMLAPSGILAQSTASVSLVADDTYLTMTPETGIEISAFDSMISINEEGITLESGGSSIEITAEGITLTGVNVTIVADVAIEATTSDVIIVADETINLEASVISIDGVEVEFI